MFRSSITLAVALCVAMPVAAQSSRVATPATESTVSHVDASGALAGRSPHKMLRPVAAPAKCGAQMHLPAGKLPTYGATAFPERCAEATRIASADKPTASAQD